MLPDGSNDTSRGRSAHDRRRLAAAGRAGARQGPVNARQRRDKTASARARRWCPLLVIADLLGALVGVLLLGYLLYALIRPDRF